ncbi:MAG: hypothetical protein M3412_01325 [Chloroflexota bacterium]|nr:hypothetical protein [Chloroflexota bacterium]
MAQAVLQKSMSPIARLVVHGMLNIPTIVPRWYRILCPFGRVIFRQAVLFRHVQPIIVRADGGGRGIGPRPGEAAAADAFCVLWEIHLVPIPKTMTKVNRTLFNPIIRPFAGRIPPLAVVNHWGRSSETAYRTPIFAFPAGSGFVIALVYGRNTDWERNVASSGRCDLVYRNQRHMLVNPHLISQDEARTTIPAPLWVALRAIRVDSFLKLDET